MSMISVSSSAIAAAGYEHGTLAVQFHSSTTIYLHHGVPRELFEGLLSSDSPGAFYNSRIKGRY